MPLSTACPKPSPRWVAKAQKRAEEAKQIKATYAAVDRRDGPSCRVCGARVGGLGMITKRIHHHIRFRSLGGKHITSNVLSICPRCDDLLHREGRLMLSGNADLVDERGRFCGVTVERLTESGWQKAGVC